MRILIVDDDIDKISDISTVINSIEGKYLIKSVECIKDAIDEIIKTKYDLLICDLQLPLRKHGDLVPHGGNDLVEEINRKSKSVKTPNFIIGMTQYEDYLSLFPDIWRVIHYSKTSTKWENQLFRFINHIINANNSRREHLEILKPSIFTEGLTDKKYLEETLKIFHPDILEKVTIHSKKSAGANWVANQVAIWGKSHHKDLEGNRVKCVGLLDWDKAGIAAKSEINRVLVSSNETGSFRVIHPNQNHNTDLIEFFKNGMKLEMDIESMFNVKYWKIADSKGWLKVNHNPFTDPPKEWNSYNQTLADYITTAGIDEDFKLYLKRFKADSKEEFQKMIMKLPKKELSAALQNVNRLATEILAYLF